MKKKKYVSKVLYIYMLGYDCGFGHIQAVNLCAANTFSEKRIGYLGCSLLLNCRSEILRLLINVLKNDLGSSDEHVQALALNCVANIGGREFTENVYSDVQKLMDANSGYSTFVRRKAIVCFLRLYRSDPRIVVSEEWVPRIQDLLRDKDAGVLLSACGLLIGVLEQQSAEYWVDILPIAIHAFSGLVAGECMARHYYYHVAAPWTQVKMLRLFQFFQPDLYGADVLEKLTDVVNRIVNRPAVHIPPAVLGKKRSKMDAEKLNRSNAEHSVLMEALNLIIHIGTFGTEEVLKSASAILGSFVSSKEANIRYLGIEAMARMANVSHMQQRFDSYRSVIIAQLTEPDISIRRQALNLLYTICQPTNWQHIVDELLEALGSVDVPMQEEMVVKIAILTEQDAPDMSWHVDVVFKMIEYAPDQVSDDVWFRLSQVITGFESNEVVGDALQRYAVSKAFESLSVSKYPHETLIKLSAHLLGEFGHLLVPNVSILSQFQMLHRHFEGASSSCKCAVLLAYAKMFSADASDQRYPMLQIVEGHLDCGSLDLQQRACELHRLLMFGGQPYLQILLDTMPAFSKHAQTNNPLTKRILLHGQGANRAVTRSQLEGIAKEDSGDNTALQSRINRDSALVALADEDGANSNRDVDDHYAESSFSSDCSSSSGSDSDRSSSVSSADGNDEALRKLLMVDKGRLLRSQHLEIFVNVVYGPNAASIRLELHIRSTCALEHFVCRVQAHDALSLVLITSAGSKIRPAEHCAVVYEVKCIKCFFNSPQLHLSYEVSGSTTILQPTLPISMSRFFSPAPMTLQQFVHFWDTFGTAQGADAHAVSGVPGFSIGDDHAKQSLISAMRMQPVETQNQHVLYFAGSFCFQRQHVQHLVACLVCVEHAKDNLLVSVRSADHTASEVLLKLAARLFLRTHPNSE